MRALPVVIAAFSIALAAGCASPRPAADPGQQVEPGQPAPDAVPGGEITVWANGTASSVRVEGGRTWGPTSELKRFDDAFRGTLQGTVVDLHYTDDRVHGMVGGSRVDLYVTTVDGKVHGQGLLNGRISTFDVDGDAIDGSFGNCAYQMKKTPESNDYRGYRCCSGALYPASRITIPESIRALPALDQATLYALMFQG